MNEKLQKLYAEYGRLVLQGEALNNGIAACRQAIQEEMRKPPQKEEKK